MYDVFGFEGIELVVMVGLGFAAALVHSVIRMLEDM